MQREQLRSDPAAFSRALADAGSITALSDASGIPRTTLNDWRKAHDNPTPSTVDAQGAFTQSYDVTVSPGTSAHDMLKQRGLNVDEWQIVSLHVQEAEAVGKGGEPLKLERMRVTVKPKRGAVDVEQIIPRPERKPWKRRMRRSTTVEQHLFIGDPHAPHHDQGLIEQTAEYAHDHNDSVASITFLGDTVDNTPFGRHRRIPRMDTISASDHLQAGHDLLAMIRERAPKADARMLIGNHDHWLTQRVREERPELEFLRYPNHPRPVLDLANLLQLDAIGVDLVRADGGEYHDSVLQVFPDLIALHGTKTGKHGGAAAEIDAWEGASVIQGHDHKIATVVVVKKLPGGGLRSHLAISAGTTASPDLGYDPRKNVARGILSVWHWPASGKWTPVHGYWHPRSQVLTLGGWSGV